MRYAAVAFLTAALVLTSAPQDRFDHKVREKFFAGFAGNREALAEGMRLCESVLAENPNHAEAMVWYGTGVFTQATMAFRSGDISKGVELQTKSLGLMDKAVELAPDSAAVRVPRGAILITASRFMPKEFGRPLLDRAISDYEHVLKMQTAYFDKLGEHPKGELLFGLAEGWSRAGNAEKATAYFTRVSKEMEGTPYARRAAKWFETKSLSPEESGCIGCHVSK